MVTASPAIEATIEGTVSGQVAVGSYILQVGNIHGGVVNLSVPGTQEVAQPRPRPVSLKPRPFAGLLDREDETAIIRAAVDVLSPVSLAGKGGSGKTVLLRRVAHLPGLKNFSDGLVYLAVKERGLDDLLQLLFDLFYSSPPNTKQTDGEIRQGLQNISALILLDDLLWERDAVESLLDVMPASTFVFASGSRMLWGEGYVIELKGLPDLYACQLFERELGRTLSEQEKASVREIVSALEHHPMRILQLAAFARKAGTALSEIRDQIQVRNPETSTAQLSLQKLSESQRKILAILGAADGAVVPLKHLAAMSRVGNLQVVLDELLSLGLVQAHSPRYSLTAVMSAALPGLWNLSSWEEALLNYFSDWVMQAPPQGLMEESSDLLMHIIKKAAAKNKWQDVVRIGRALEPFFILWKRWQAWSEIASLILNAARALGDRSLEAWMLHQMGTRAMCLGRPDEARELLTRALNLRRVSGDRQGRTVTQHNLDVLNGGFVPPRSKPNEPGGSGGGLGFFNTFVLWIVALGAITFFGVLWMRDNPPWTKPPGPAAPIIPTQALPTSTLPPTAIETTSIPPSSTPFPPIPPTATLPPPTITPTVTPSSTPIPCLLARWVRDVTIPDGTSIQPGASFTKAWELRNDGSCTWDSGYRIIYVAGSPMSTNQVFMWTGGTVGPGGNTVISVNLVAPLKAGLHQSDFLLLAPDGRSFGLGANNKAFWARITVPEIPTITPSTAPDVQGPYPPQLLSPEKDWSFSCHPPTQSPRQLQFLQQVPSLSVTLAWKEALDPSGISQYEVMLEEVVPGSTWWQTVKGFPKLTNELSLVIETTCWSRYRWKVRARDGAGNWGNYGEERSFEVMPSPTLNRVEKGRIQ
jgi:hypothetical protein